MVPSAVRTVVAIEIEDEGALTRTAVEVAARAISSLVQDDLKSDDQREFKFSMSVNGESRPAFLEQATLYKDGTISAEARVIVFSSPIEGTLYFIDLAWSQQKWSARLNMASPITND